VADEERERLVRASNNTPSHTPDASRLPSCVTGWIAMTEDQLFHDGEQWLMAVPVCGEVPVEWHYEYAVVTVRCDDHYIGFECDENPWSWGLDSVDFGVRLAE
jgi:hypothetical protein